VNTKNQREADGEQGVDPADNETIEQLLKDHPAVLLLRLDCAVSGAGLAVLIIG
jgi:hypothetical protein